ncbi:chitinase A domain protein [Clostridium botulinum 202F]|nr:chitinase A domain protein [Clostridium botulinum 202F]KAI3346346.1 hypothetical protein CIT17_09255 [Clostridium botulinum]
MEEDKSKEKLIDSTEELPKDTTMDKGVIEDNLKDEFIDNSEKEIKNNLKETIENN